MGHGSNILMINRLDSIGQHLTGVLNLIVRISPEKN